MKKYNITIARQFGSLGRPIARRLSEILEINYYDRDIVERAAEKISLSVSEVSEQEERAKGIFFKMKYPLGMPTLSVQDQIFQAQKEFIVEVADKESCIIVGRCSDFILEGNPNHMSIFIYAPYAERMKNCVNSLGLSPQEAETMIAEVDKARDLYHLRYANYLPSDIKHKSLMIDSSVLGVDKTAEYIADLVHKKFDE